MRKAIKPLLIVVLIMSLAIIMLGCQDKDTHKGTINIDINNAEDLMAIKQKLGKDYDSATFNLKADIDLSGKVWEPIGTSYTNAFHSKFNGNGHTISNITIGDVSKSTEGVENLQTVYTPLTTYGVGLFGYTVDASISNLNITFNYRFSSGYDATYVGGLVGCAFGNNTYSNIGLSGKIDVIAEFNESYEINNGNPTYDNSDYCYVGGVVGYAIGTTIIDGISGEVEFINKENSSEREGVNNQNGDIKEFTNHSRFNTMQIGGIGGYVRNINISASGTEPRNAIKNTNLVTKIQCEADRMFAGTIVGSAYSTDITNVKISDASALYTNTQFRIEVGGIAGLLDNSNLTNAQSYLTNLYVAKALRGKTQDLARVSFVAGGAVGFATNNSVISKTDVFTNIMVDGRCIKYAGGLLGIMSNSRLYDSTACGDFANSSFGTYVSLTEDVRNQSDYKVGGAVGKMFGKSRTSEADGSADIYDIDTKFTAYQGLVYEAVARLEVITTTGADGKDKHENKYHMPIISNGSCSFINMQSVGYLLNKAYQESGNDPKLELDIPVNGLGQGEETSAKYDQRIASRNS